MSRATCDESDTGEVQKTAIGGEGPSPASHLFGGFSQVCEVSETDANPQFVYR